MDVVLSLTLWRMMTLVALSIRGHGTNHVRALRVSQVELIGR